MGMIISHPMIYLCSDLQRINYFDYRCKLMRARANNNIHKLA